MIKLAPLSKVESYKMKTWSEDRLLG